MFDRPVRAVWLDGAVSTRNWDARNAKVERHVN